MSTIETRTSNRTVTTPGFGPVEVTLTDRGDGHPYLLLHGGAGPQSVNGFADLLAATEHARVITPAHPGFGGTPRPEVLASVASLAELYVGLLDALDLVDVTVIGNSIGGWIASEIALLHSSRISSFILVDAMGILVEGHPVVDFFSLSLAEVAQRSYFDPEKFRIDPSKLPPAAQATMAGNRAALAVYGGATMGDASLLARLRGITAPTLVIWGEADRIADTGYGRAYAEAIPGARFMILKGTGHVPQVETPEALIGPVGTFARAHSKGRAIRP